jgi:hypothetical protein
MNWYVVFLGLFFAFILVLLATRDKKYLLYFVAGSIFGFYFDFFSFAFGYYSYPNIYVVTVLGLPLSMTIAEGFSVSIIFFVYNTIRKYFAKPGTTL